LCRPTVSDRSRVTGDELVGIRRLNVGDDELVSLVGPYHLRDERARRQVDVVVHTKGTKRRRRPRDRLVVHVVVPGQVDVRLVVHFRVDFVSDADTRLDLLAPGNVDARSIGTGRRRWVCAAGGDCGCVAGSFEIATNEGKRTVVVW